MAQVVEHLSSKQVAQSYGATEKKKERKITQKQTPLAHLPSLKASFEIIKHSKELYSKLKLNI
jgi:hypothetical protein